MYKCHDCKLEFEEPEFIEEQTGEFWGTPYIERFGTCPCCGSENYEEVETCPCCKDEFIFPSQDICGHCEEFIVKAYDELLSVIASTYNIEDKEQIKDWLEEYL